MAAARRHRAAEWDALAPGAPYACHAWETRLLGRTVPGRGGGTVTGCATPSRARPKEGQVVLGLPLAGLGGVMPRSRARDRIRQAARGGTVGPDDGASIDAAAARQRRRNDFPEAIGVPYPHRRGSTPCASDHPMWTALERDIKAARKRADRLAGDAAEPEDLHALAVAELDRKHPKYRGAALACVQQHAGRERARAGKAVESTHRTAGRKRAAAVARGEDVGAAEYRDTLVARLRGRR
jgi:hypothetical protein